MDDILGEEDDGEDTPDWAGERGGQPDRGADTAGQGGRPEGTGGRPAGVGGGDEDSDRPAWAGTPGGSAGRGGSPNSGDRGDFFGDLYVILRDTQGTPELTNVYYVTDEQGNLVLDEEGNPITETGDLLFVQPIDAEGNPIPLDIEGHPIDETLTQEVEIGRLNVSRSPNDVLEKRASEVVNVLSPSTDPDVEKVLSLDPAGRLLITTIDNSGAEPVITAKTIDSPLENLAIYVSLMTTGTIAGLHDLPGEEFDFMVDGTNTVEDLAAAASFLAAASDKSGEFTTDEIAYVNSVLGIKTSTVEGSDYSEFTYDRSDTYEDVAYTVLFPQTDGNGNVSGYVPTEVGIYDAVFGSADPADDMADGTLAIFTQAADARAVIEFIHEHEVPADQL